MQTVFIVLLLQHGRHEHTLYFVTVLQIELVVVVYVGSIPTKFNVRSVNYQ